jgi:hypothetical protein
MSHCILVPETSAPDMLLPLQGRSDIVLKRFGPKVTAPEFRALLGNVNAMVLGVTPIADAELDAAPQLKRSPGLAWAMTRSTCRPSPGARSRC